MLGLANSSCLRPPSVAPHHLHGAASSNDNVATQTPRLRSPTRSLPTKQVKSTREVLTNASTVQQVMQSTSPDPSLEYDAIVIGSGMGGLAAAGQLVAKGAKVLVLEKYIIPGGSAGFYDREGYTFDVGSSMMFGFGEEGTTNLLTKALESVGKKMETVPDPTQIYYHLPKSEAHPDGLKVQVWRDYEKFIAELTDRFPHEKEGIRRFYDECWVVFNALNSLELKSLEEPLYLLDQFSKQPAACLNLAWRVAQNTGDVARKFIKDEELLNFIDMECFCWSTVDANMTPLINAGMVFCDRHFGGINYPIGGVGKIAVNMAEGFMEKGGDLMYKANVSKIITEGEGDEKTAVGVQLLDGKVFRAKTVISNATRWDTFEGMIGEKSMPESEVKFRGRYKKSPSFLSMHLGVKADLLSADEDCHHIILEDWCIMENPRGTLFVSIPTLLDPSLSPDGTHIIHAFTPDWIDAWQGMNSTEYKAKKEEVSNAFIDRLESVFPGIQEAVLFKEVGTPRTHKKFLGRNDGSYGPIPSRRPLGMMGMPMNTTSIKGLYCVGDSTFPGQGVNAVVFSGFGCAHRVLCDLGKQPTIPVVDGAFKNFLNYIRDSA